MSTAHHSKLASSGVISKPMSKVPAPPPTRPFPSQTMDRFIVRLPDGLRDRIAAAAKENGRSMNAEIVRVLETYYPAPPSLQSVLRDLELTLALARDRRSKPNLLRLEAQLENLRESLVEDAKSGNDE